MALELQPVHTRHSHIYDEARCLAQLTRLQETFGRFEACCSEAKRLDQQCCALAGRLVIVNHRDKCLRTFQLHSVRLVLAQTRNLSTVGISTLVEESM